ncbi:ribbon-helix-helix protein, CopG family [Shimia sp.]|jgi:metal-responsive CopG/Arc/MetJ family transcriptional regulator|uniref:ribbon-helix-helix protein, CopG family n=1 Tax=unclassified Shimia TaxID=2630038 RepID=UPI0025F032C6|nr:ribbon-helix-helix protein, CopG family [Shimia sp.]MCH2066493.1 ribbon-helix-helix protein, CopG family [Shimia sp.]
MTKSANDNQKFRFTVDVSQRLAGEIERISQATGRSKADVFRLAIELLSTARDAKEDGMHVGAWSETEDTRKEREFVNFG